MQYYLVHKISYSLILLSFFVAISLLNTDDAAFAQFARAPDLDLDMLVFDPCIYVTDPICLRISHNSITEGGIVTFGGKYGANYDLRIIDSSSDNVIASTTTDSAGNFSVTWTAQYNNGKPYGFYAQVGSGEFIDRSNSVTLDVLPRPLTLSVSNSNTIEGDPIIFSGSYIVGGNPQIGEEIQIIDQTRNEIIGRVQTDSTGRYGLEWTSVYSDNNPYEFYAKAPSRSTNSDSDTVSVTVNRISFTLDSDPSDVYDGDIINFSGRFLFNGSPISNIPITINERTYDIPIDGGFTDTNGEFSAIWQAGYDEDNNNTYEFYATFEVPSYSTDSAYMLAPRYDSRSFESNNVSIRVLDYAESELSLTLNSLPIQIKEGESLAFSGIFEQINNDSVEPLAGFPICIVNDESEEIITFGKTDDDGSYVARWIVESQEKQPFEFYAVSYDDCNYYENSTDFEDSTGYEYFQESQRQQTRLGFDSSLILDQIPSTANIGDRITLTGHVTENRFSGESVWIRIEGMIEYTDDLDRNGEFSIEWEIQSDDIGEHTVYAECLCSGSNLVSESFDITIIPNIPLKPEIIADKTSGKVNSVINLSSRVSGGTAPYSYTWSIDGQEMSDKTSTINPTFSESGDYKVVLTVTDSLGMQDSDDIFIKIQDTITYPDQFINVSDERFEGSKITFSVIDEYPVPPISHLWKFNDGTEYNIPVVTKTFDDDGSYQVTLAVIDENRVQRTSNTTVDVSNVEPKINSVKQSAYEIETKETVLFEASFIDPGDADTFIIEWFLDSESIKSENKNEPSSVDLQHLFLNAGNPEIKLVVTDDDGGRDEHVFSVSVSPPENRFPWDIIIIAILIAGGGAGAKYLLKHKPDAPTHQDHHTDSKPENDNEPKKQPSIDMDIEFRSGVEKK